MGVVLDEELVTVGIHHSGDRTRPSQFLGLLYADRVLQGAAIENETGSQVDNRSDLGKGTDAGGMPEAITDVDYLENIAP